MIPDPWQSRAACAGVTTGLFHGTEDEPKSSRQRRVDTALSICADCPLDVKRACLEDAIKHRDAWGIRGGLTGPQIRDLLPPIHDEPDPPARPAVEKRVPPDCGNPGTAAQKRHSAYGEHYCDACRAHRSAYRAAYRARKKANAA